MWEQGGLMGYRTAHPPSMTDSPQVAARPVSGPEERFPSSDLLLRLERIEQSLRSLGRTIPIGQEGSAAPLAEAGESRTPVGQPLIDRIIEGIPAGGMGDMGYVPTDVLIQPRASYQNLIQRVIRETAEAGQVVFVAHGASIPLAGMSGLLRVLVTASTTVRAERLTGGSNMGEREARRAVQVSDRERQNFFRSFYNLRQELPIHYDLVVNTDRLDVPEAARLIATAAQG